MLNKKAFTLFELLIAAAIMSVLAMLGTAAYKRSASMTRIEDGKNKTRAVANAMMRFMLDHDNMNYTGGLVLNFQGGNAADTCPRRANFDDAGMLVQCDYLENRAWSTPDITIVTCNGTKNGTLCEDSAVGDPLACMTGSSDRLDSQFLHAAKGNGYVFCVGRTAELERKRE